MLSKIHSKLLAWILQFHKHAFEEREQKRFTTTVKACICCRQNIFNRTMIKLHEQLLVEILLITITKTFTKPPNFKINDYKTKNSLKYRIGPSFYNISRLFSLKRIKIINS